MIVDVVRPRNIKEAVRAKGQPGAAYLGGGTWLNSGQVEEKTILVSLENLGLDGIEAAGDECSIGATVTLQRLVDSSEAPAVLREAARLTASRTLRNMITIGGELGRAADDSALIPVLMVLKARVALAGRKKHVAVESFLRDRTDGLILGVVVPDRSRPSVVRCVSRTSHGARSLVVAASLVDRSPRSWEARIVVSDCRGQRMHLREVVAPDAPLAEKSRIEAVVKAAFAPAEDPHASAAYKRYMAGVLVADALHQLAVREPTP